MKITIWLLPQDSYLADILMFLKVLNLYDLRGDWEIEFLRLYAIYCLMEISQIVLAIIGE